MDYKIVILKYFNMDCITIPYNTNVHYFKANFEVDNLQFCWACLGSASMDHFFIKGNNYFCVCKYFFLKLSNVYIILRLECSVHKFINV